MKKPPIISTPQFDLMALAARDRGYVKIAPRQKRTARSLVSIGLLEYNAGKDYVRLSQRGENWFWRGGP